MWTAVLRAAALRRGLLTAERLHDVSTAEVEEVFRVEEETVADPAQRAALWRDVSEHLLAGYEGSVGRLLEACGSHLGGPGGLLDRLAPMEAFADPLAKKSQLFGKIAVRRGWIDVVDPGAWEVCADNVLMRLALRSGLVETGPLDEVRAATRAALKRVAADAEIEPPVLDDLLWELGRENPDLLGVDAGDLREPPRRAGSHWY